MGDFFVGSGDYENSDKCQMNTVLAIIAMEACDQMPDR